MNILSIDVGIKNLALCLFVKDIHTNQIRVTKWDVLNIAEQNDIQLCQTIGCNKSAKYSKHDMCFCTKHAKKQTYLIPTTEQKSIKKHKIAILYDIAKKYGIVYDDKIKKADLVTLINNHFQLIFFDTITTVKAADIDLYSLGTNMMRKLNTFFGDTVHCIDNVIIENQIGPLAVRMKTLQGMLVQYFVMSHIKVNKVEFISASNKLKDCDAKDIQKYSDRKKMGITKCLNYLTQDERFIEHCQFFNKHSKKDDLADSFLQGIWYMNHYSSNK